MVVRPANINPGYTLLSSSTFAKGCTVASDIPDSNFPTFSFSASCGTAPATPNSEKHGWLRFNGGPLLPGRAYDFTALDGTLARGYPISVLLSGAIGTGRANDAESAEIDCAATIYLATVDFDPTVMTWNTEPSTAGFPVASLVNLVGPGGFDVGLSIPINQALYGLAIKLAPFPPLLSSGNVNSSGYTPSLLILNV